MSFSLDTKIEASQFPMKKTCCRRAFINGILLTSAEECGGEVTLYIEGVELANTCAKLIGEQFGREAEIDKGGRDVFLVRFSSKSASGFLNEDADSFSLLKYVKCPECSAAFLRGIFVGGGTVNEPNKKNYHFEIKCRTDKKISAADTAFSDNGFELKASKRFEKQSLYSKDSDFIGDFLFFIGANKHAFDFMNAKISHEIKNDINRRTNCETSNIARSTASAAKHIAAIKFLVEHGRLSELGTELEYTARMRIEQPEMSLVQLGQAMTPPVSKSGLYHRLEKICAYSESIKTKEV